MTGDPEQAASRRKARLFRRIAAPAVSLAIRALARTLRISMDGREGFERAMQSARPVVFAFWHEDLFGIAALHLRLNRGRPFSRPVAVMISRSRDGEMLAGVVERLGLTPVRGSSSRGGPVALIGLAHWLKGTGGKAPIVALALDGPRGPRRIAKPGVALLARKSGALVVPAAFRFSSRWTFKSWDRTKLAKPWATLECRFGAPMDAAEWTGGDEALAAKLAAALAAASEEP